MQIAEELSPTVKVLTAGGTLCKAQDNQRLRVYACVLTA